MKIVLKRSKFTKGGKCKGKIRRAKGRNGRRTCMKMVKVKSR